MTKPTFIRDNAVPLVCAGVALLSVIALARGDDRPPARTQTAQSTIAAPVPATMPEDASKADFAGRADQCVDGYKMLVNPRPDGTTNVVVLACSDDGLDQQVAVLAEAVPACPGVPSIADANLATAKSLALVFLERVRAEQARQSRQQAAGFSAYASSAPSGGPGRSPYLPCQATN